MVNPPALVAYAGGRRHWSPGVLDCQVGVVRGAAASGREALA